MQQGAFPGFDPGKHPAFVCAHPVALVALACYDLDRPVRAHLRHSRAEGPMSDALARFIDRLHEAFHEDDSRSADKAEEQRNVACLQGLFRALLGPDSAAFRDGLAEDVVMEIVGPSAIP